MLIFPAIDLYEGKAVRLLRGDYAQMTVYSEHPEEIALQFAASGAEWIHLVDLEGAKSGETPNLETVKKIVACSGLKAEVGGGIRNLQTVRAYLEAGVSRVILGTAAVTDEAFLKEALDTYGEKIAVGVDIKDGKVAIKGWTVASEYYAIPFCEKLQRLGVRTVICTDISRDGAMMGTNHALYQTLADRFDLQIIASGGVSSMEDVLRLAEKKLYGAIIGKAYYTGAIELSRAIEVAK